ncbi:MAG TPA: tRNA (adenine-N1)-methyltransferase [Methanomassiliicoccales archaeon]|nr:tRNA (adenine-N1)-methyltransferase [Methanomassiliicoccales archaeon]
MLHEGELVYLLDEKGRRHWLQLASGMVKMPGLGVVNASKLIGQEEGSTIVLGDMRLVVLRPGAQELMESLDRGPQIILPKDAATIVFKLDLKPGDAVVESGVGSGSLTTALLNAVGAEGMVVSIEIREEFASKARRNVARSPFAKAWDIRIGDVVSAPVEAEVDAVVLDMPNPWDALPNVGRFLRPGGRFCAYVPNANQVEKLVWALRSSGYVEIEALENMQRRLEVHEGGVRPSYESMGHTGYMVFARRSLPALSK